MRVTFQDAKGWVEQERTFLHGWATKSPFAFALIFGAVTFVIGTLIG